MYDVAEDARLVTEFALNVVGTTQFPTLVISGIITSEANGTASKQPIVKWAICTNLSHPLSLSPSVPPPPSLSLSLSLYR